MIKTIDIEILADGHGSVNNNGSIKVWNGDEVVENHTIPKLRGFTGKKRVNDMELAVNVTDINLKETPAYVSANCFKHGLFKEEMWRMLNDAKNTEKLLCSMIGLVQGYMVTEKNSESAVRKQAMFVTDMVEQTGNGNLEYFNRDFSSREKKENEKQNNFF